MTSIPSVQSILKSGKVPILFTASDADIQVNPLGLRVSLDTMRWEGRSHFKNAPWTSIEVETSEGHAFGVIKNPGNLWYAELADAGHMVSIT